MMTDLAIRRLQAAGASLAMLAEARRELAALDPVEAEAAAWELFCRPEAELREDVASHARARLEALCL